MKNVIFTIRIDSETNEMIAFLKNHNVKYNDNIRESIKLTLAKKCSEFNINTKSEGLPF